MWELYRKTVIPMQMVILTVALIFIFVIHAPVLSVLILFLVLQGFAILGAAWGVRLRSKFDRRDERRRSVNLRR